MKTLKALINKSNIKGITSDRVNPGDMLKDGDLVLVAVEGPDSYKEIRYGTYIKNGGSGYTEGKIKYFEALLDYSRIRENFVWCFNDKYTHTILKVYRPFPGKDHSLKPMSKNDTLIGEVESSKDYYCVYINRKELKKHNLSL